MPESPDPTLSDRGALTTARDLLSLARPGASRRKLSPPTTIESGRMPSSSRRRGRALALRDLAVSGCVSAGLAGADHLLEEGPHAAIR
jgi:hypothetical protein